jgi:hypothetical protein
MGAAALQEERRKCLQSKSLFLYVCCFLTKPPKESEFEK